MQGNIDVKNQPSVSEKLSQKQEVAATSESLPKNVSMQLYSLMLSVTGNEITPATVNAACNCASEIHKILKLNLDMKRAGL